MPVHYPHVIMLENIQPLCYVHLQKAPDSLFWPLNACSNLLTASFQVVRMTREVRLQNKEGNWAGVSYQFLERVKGKAEVDAEGSKDIVRGKSCQACRLP